MTQTRWKSPFNTFRASRDQIVPRWSGTKTLTTLSWDQFQLEEFRYLGVRSKEGVAPAGRGEESVESKDKALDLLGPSTFRHSPVVMRSGSGLTEPDPGFTETSRLSRGGVRSCCSSGFKGVRAPPFGRLKRTQVQHRSSLVLSYFQWLPC